ncbi:MAG TPA: pilus assembly protein PilP [Bdellovibrionota bacterium]|nr:pilus assembly protein PilP [Bdellovibrionota bacterium]
MTMFPRASAFLLPVLVMNLATDLAGALASPATSPGSAAATATAATTEAASGSPLSDDLLKMRDPFKRPFFEVKKGPPKHELENYALDSLKLIGVLTGPVRMRAMLLTPDGKTFIVSEKTKIGTRSGEIRRITSESVHVRENVVNILGQPEKIDSVIYFQHQNKNDERSGALNPDSNPNFSPASSPGESH